MFGSVRIQVAGVRGIIGVPFLAILEKTKQPSWQQLHNTLKEMRLDALVDLGGFFCVMEEGYHCCSPPGMFLWEFSMDKSVSITMNYNCLDKGSFNEDFARSMLKAVKPALELCCHPAHQPLETRLKAGHECVSSSPETRLALDLRYCFVLRWLNGSGCSSWRPRTMLR